MLNKLFKSIIEQDRAPVVICDTKSVIVYMNPSAKEMYRKDLTGSCVKDCHPKDANKKIDEVIAWFGKRKTNNIIHTYYSEKENKDVYMIALRDENEDLIGYYEKHESRNRETSAFYNMKNI